MRVLWDRPLVLAWIYAVASAVLGPAVFLGGYVFFTQGVGDYCDAVHGTAAARDSAFRAAQIFQVTGAVVMLAIGVALLVRLWKFRDRLRWYFTAAGVAAVIVMMAGFGFLILVSGPGGQSC